MRSMPVRQEKPIKAVKKVSAPKRKPISDPATPVPNTIDETINFVILGQLSSPQRISHEKGSVVSERESSVPEKESVVRAKKNTTRSHRILRKFEGKNLRIKPSKEIIVKSNSKAQTKAAKKLSAQNSCKKKFNNKVAEIITQPIKEITLKKPKLESVSKDSKKKLREVDKPKITKKTIVKARTIIKPIIRKSKKVTVKVTLKASKEPPVKASKGISLKYTKDICIKTPKDTSVTSVVATKDTYVKTAEGPQKTTKDITIKTTEVAAKPTETTLKKTEKYVKTNNKPPDVITIPDEDEIKKQQTIKQLLKQVNEEIKSKKTKTAKIKKRKKISVNPAENLVKSKDKAEELFDQIVKLESVYSPLEIKIKEEKPEPKVEISSEDIPVVPKTELCLDNEKSEDTSKSEAEVKPEVQPKVEIESQSRSESDSSSKEKQALLKKKKYIKLKSKPKLTVIKKRVLQKGKNNLDEQACKTKLFKFWNGPKRHRVASLNALAKVHCLYENETRATILDVIEESNKTAYMPKNFGTKTKLTKTDTSIKNVDFDEEQEQESSPPPTRILRSVPGLRAVGKHWDMHDTTSSDEDDRICRVPVKTDEKPAPPKPKIKKEVVERKRKSSEIVMDLKDMVVRKRMASLNATAILAASYSQERRQHKSKYSDDSSSCTSNSSDEYFAALDKDIKVEQDDKKEELIDISTTPNKKVAVILNQDTDVTITGVYVNSTTRSTHHEGYCSIAGMQYRISATSHTQTASTAVSTEAILQSSSTSGPENSNSESLPSSKSYTPLDALSNMQPPPGPGIQHPVLHGQQMGPPQHVLPMPPHQLSPGLRHSCSSAFSSPHSTPGYPTPPGHHPPVTGEAHAGYYQPAGPLITVPPSHGQPTHPPPPPPIKTISLSETSPSSSTTPSVISHDVPPPPPSSNGDSSDSEVIITSVTTAKDSVPPPSHPPAAYRYQQYPGYSYSYPPHSYPYPTPPPNSPYSHHDMCYSPNPYVHHKYPIRRYLTQYYPPPNPPEIYQVPPSGPSSQNQQVVSATPPSASGASYSSAPPPTIMETYAPPQTALVESYQPPPPAHYYPPPVYGPPTPPCYSSRSIPYINAYQSSCPCPMQSCPKNVLTGPLTGNCKRSNMSSISKDSMPLPPVAIMLPLEPASATGPPSPARGSAGMPPPPSPAGATYQAPPVSTKQESSTPANQEDCKTEKKRKPRIGKAMVRDNIAASMQQNTMLLMCNPSQNCVKREIESPKDSEIEQKTEISGKELQPCEIDLLQDSCLKEDEPVKEESQSPISLPSKEETPPEEPKEEPPNPLPPVINTVAENVKVKNMKRKLSMLSDKEPSPEIVIPQKKRQKTGSYKSLIKKDTNAVKINNGKIKLLGEMSKPRQNRAKLKKSLKRMHSMENEATVKRRKVPKLLPINNFKSKEVNPLTETKEKKTVSLKKVNSKCSSKPASEKVSARSNVDIVIDNVISDACIRTQEECVGKSEKCAKSQTNGPVLNKKSTNKSVVSKKLKLNPKTTENTRRKSKSSEEVIPPPAAKIVRRVSTIPKWSNGWMWEGEPYEAKVFLNSDELTVYRTCYPAMRHRGGDKIVPRDCVLLKAGPRKNDLPFVAKIASLWENPEDGEMMMSLLWYYRPEHTEQGRLPADRPDEVFASRHKDSNSVACIDDKCYVLTFNEYCRYRKTYKRIEAGIEEVLPCIPNPEPYPRSHRQPPMTLVSPEMVFFCRRVYDFRQKRIMKNPT
ncbi:uncharacterized protein Hers [Diabrotica undecimpunctata]|uniref:uncharacterized protein Hers n=1 Tax=Diabrotica undecimpunctata TaxID=50387 RepID=UPI003B63D0B3